MLSTVVLARNWTGDLAQVLIISINLTAFLFAVPLAPMRKSRSRPCSFSMPEDLLNNMDDRAASLRMSRTEYLKALVRIDLHVRPEFLAVPADGAAVQRKARER